MGDIMEIKQTGIYYFKTFEEMANALKGHFKAVVLEKHPKVMLNIIMDRALKSTLKNYNRTKISQKALKKFLDQAKKEFRRYYGEWVNIYDFNIRTGVFSANFEAIYKTNLGRLYGGYPGSIHDHLFYTAHSFEQFRDRGRCYEAFPLLVLAYRRIRNTEPTPADLLKFMVLNAYEYCFTDNFIYVNVHRGVLVLERLSGGIMIAKTFLLPDMDYPKKGWVRSEYAGLIIDPTDFAKNLFTDKEKISTPIKKPDFTGEDCSYADYQYILESQAQNSSLNT